MSSFYLPFLVISLFYFSSFYLSLNLLILTSCGSKLLLNPSTDLYTLITSFGWLWRHILIWFSSCISGCSVSVLHAGSSSSSLLLNDEVPGAGLLNLFSFSQPKPLSRWSHQSCDYKYHRYADDFQIYISSSDVSPKLLTSISSWLRDLSAWKFAIWAPDLHSQILHFFPLIWVNSNVIIGVQAELLQSALLPLFVSHCKYYKSYRF